MRNLAKNSQFVLLFAGRLTTNVGDSLYWIGTMWLAYELTGSSFFVGVAGFLARSPTALQFLFGPLADRWDLKRTLVGTQFVQGAFVLLVPIAALTDLLSVWVILPVVLIVSVTDQLATPAFHATLPQIVDDENIPQANSLFSTAAQGFNAVFNGLSGLVIAIFGATILFLVNSVTFFVAMLLFGRMVPVATEDKDPDEEQNYFTEIREGIDYLRGSLVFQIVIAATFTNFGYGVFLAILPEFADALGGPSTYGLLMAAMAGGTFIGALAASFIGDVQYGRFLIFGYLFTSICIFLAVGLPGRLLTAGFFFLASISLGAYAVLTRSMMQTVVDDQLLGRVMSVVQSMYEVMVPVGSIVGGVIAATLAPTEIFYLIGALYVLNLVYFSVHPTIRSLPRIQKMDEEMLNLGTSG